MNDVTRIVDAGEETLEQLSKSVRDYYAGIVGRTLRKHYPTIDWLVTIKMDKTGGLAFIQVPQISLKHGIAVMLTERVPLLEDETKKAGGEFLERFRVTRDRRGDAAADLFRIKRNILGEAIGAATGEG